jgi:serine/threonine-protein kinase SRPK3
MADASTNDCRELLANKLKETGLDREFGGKYICLPLGQFQIDGPNGSHFCFVYPVLGPRVSCVLKKFEDPDRDLRKIALQAVGIVCLHNHGICHGG